MSITDFDISTCHNTEEMKSCREEQKYFSGNNVSFGTCYFQTNWFCKANFFNKRKTEPNSSNQVKYLIKLYFQSLSLLKGKCLPDIQTVRYRTSTPLNTIIMFVPQQEAWIVERMGRFNRMLDPGLNFLMPFIDRVKYVQSLKEITIAVDSSSAITVDNVTLGIDGVLYLRILDPYLGNSNIFLNGFVSMKLYL